MKKQFAWLWQNMDIRYRRRHVIALFISVFTSLLLLINPSLSRRLIDDVIMAQNPDPLLPILAVMLAVKPFLKKSVEKVLTKGWVGAIVCMSVSTRLG